MTLRVLVLRYAAYAVIANLGVRIVTVLPGFVATPTTDGMDLPTNLGAQFKDVGQAIAQAVTKRRCIKYVEPIWKLVMLVIRCNPKQIFENNEIVGSASGANQTVFITHEALNG